MSGVSWTGSSSGPINGYGRATRCPVLRSVNRLATWCVDWPTTGSMWSFGLNPIRWRARKVCQRND